jgi:hypothetical protein
LTGFRVFCDRIPTTGGLPMGKVVANERIHTVAVLVVIDGGLIDRPLQGVAARSELVHATGTRRFRT